MDALEFLKARSRMCSCYRGCNGCPLERGNCGLSTSISNEEYERIVNHICNKCESVENRLYNEDVMSPQYKKIQAVSILEDCNKITAKANKRGTYETLPSKKEFAKIVATAKYFVENYLDDKAILKESTNAEFNRFIKEESNYISQVL